jgi:PAS domain S-box-containing protein
VNKKLRILLVEDDPSDATLVERELRKGGLHFTLQRVETEADYRQALDHPLDLILSDHDLPTFNGLAALAIAKEKAEDVPFIFVTGSVGEEVAIQSLRDGATDYVRKRRLSALVPAVGRALKAAEERQRRHAAEEAWRRSEERFRMLVEHVSDYAIYMLDAGGHVITWNEGAQRIEGYRAEEIIGQHVSRLFTSEEVAGNKPQRTLELAKKEGRSEEEGWRARKDGTPFWARVILTALRNDLGELYGFSRISQDLTERKRAEENLRRSEERFRLLVEGVQDYAICLLDTDGRVISWNSASERIEGYRSQDLVGQHFSFVFNQEDQRCGRPQQALEVASAQRHFEGEFWLVRKDGSGYWANVVLSALHADDGRLIGFTEVIRNITERKRCQDEIQRWNAELEQRVNQRTAQLEVANKELEAFSYSVSHDLRAPLRHIEGFIAMLRESAEKNLNEHQQQLLQVIDSSAKKMDRLIDELLAFSRTARAEMLQRKVDLVAVLEQARNELRSQSQGRKIKWTVHPLPEIDGDPAMLRQVLINLLANSLKYTARCTQTEIEVGSSQSEREYIFFVRDNGVGFDSGYAHKLFGVFQRLHPAHEFPGTGIGLAIVRRIIARHGGRTWAEGEVDHGATFYFSIPKSGHT